jgi:carboxymethylenebutenolidase
MTTPDEIARTPRVPVLANLSDRDAYVPLEGVAAFKKAHPEVDVNVYPANHGFNCDRRGAYDEPSAKMANERTLAFFAKNLK